MGTTQSSSSSGGKAKPTKYADQPSATVDRKHKTLRNGDKFQHSSRGDWKTPPHSPTRKNTKPKLDDVDNSKPQNGGTKPHSSDSRRTHRKSNNDRPISDKHGGDKSQLLNNNYLPSKYPNPSRRGGKPKYNIVYNSDNEVTIPREMTEILLETDEHEIEPADSVKHNLIKQLKLDVMCETEGRLHFKVCTLNF